MMNNDIGSSAGPPTNSPNFSAPPFEPMTLTVWPKPVVKWDVFGSQQLVVHMTVKPSWWQRFWTRVFFGSIWTDL